MSGEMTPEAVTAPEIFLEGQPPHPKHARDFSNNQDANRNQTHRDRRAERSRHVKPVE